MSRFRAFTFTHNNYTEDDIAIYRAMDVKYLVAGKETGQSGTKHLQGYVEYKDACTLNSAIRRLKGAHIEIRKGTAEQASNYCKKGEQSHEEWTAAGKDGPNFGLNADFFEVGEMGPGQGARKPLEEVAERIKAKVSLKRIADEFPTDYIRYHRGIEALQTIYLPPRDKDYRPVIEWRWGLAGRGKSHICNARHGDNPCSKHPESKWW